MRAGRELHVGGVGGGPLVLPPVDDQVSVDQQADAVGGQALRRVPQVGLEGRPDFCFGNVRRRNSGQAVVDSICTLSSRAGKISNLCYFILYG